MRDDMKNHYAATLAKVHGVGFTIAIVHDAPSVEVFEHAGIDVTVNPRAGHRRGDRPLRPRPAHAAGGDARGRPRSRCSTSRRARAASTSASVPRHADPRRADRRDRPGRRGDLPARRRRAPRRATGRSSSPSRSACPRSSGRCDAARRAGLGASAGRGRSPSTSAARSISSATLTKYLSLATLVPGRGRARLRRVAVAVPRSPARSPAAPARLLERLTRGDHGCGTREGFLVVSLTWLVAAALRRAPVPPLGRPAARPSARRATSSRCPASRRRARPCSRTSRRSRTRSLLWRQFTQWLGGIGIIVLALAVLPRLRVGGRQLLEYEMPGPEIESLSTRIRDTARRALAALPRR